MSLLLLFNQHPSAPPPSEVKFRKTLAEFGTGVGKRQEVSFGGDGGGDGIVVVLVRRDRAAGNDDR